MCGIFGIINKENLIDRNELTKLAKRSERRGKDSSGVLFFANNSYSIIRSDSAITNLLRDVKLNNCNFIMGHSRLATNGMNDNQPVVRDDICVIHNGIIVNDESLWGEIKLKRKLVIDTEIIAAIVKTHLESGGEYNEIPNKVLELCKGVVACAIAIPKLGKLFLFSNNGSLYLAQNDERYIFASEKFTLINLGCKNIQQIREDGFLVDIPSLLSKISIDDEIKNSKNLLPELGKTHEEENLLEYKPYNLIRCSKCVLPSTMPFIRFDERGICNYCLNYKTRNSPKPKFELMELVDSYRKSKRDDCIVPFSGGRDSCYGLHLIVKELKLKPITYTYDWGMVTDLGRRNISRMCGKLGVENIIISDNISLKRRNIARNLEAWLKSPHLGMISILTAGDKHFFRHIESIKKETQISLNLWGINPLEITHFKSGFLGVPPDFEESLVYSSGALKQLRYQYLRMKEMLKSPGYFNRSLWDTLSGEYYRSFHEKSDYYHIFDYWKWDENIINKTLINEYDWEVAPDTKTTWRIGDGTAAFYNYIYYTVAGFTEHDTFRSNQIREGDITRTEALALIEDENRPRYPNIKWYLDAIDMDFTEVIKVINKIPRLCEI